MKYILPMITKKILAIVAVAIAAFSANASAATLFDETFESYSDSAAFQNAYTGITGTGGSDNVKYTLGISTGEGAGGSDKFAVLNINSSLQMEKGLIGDATAVPGTTGNEVVLSYYIKMTDWSNSRAGVQLRNGTTTIFGIGSYNTTTSNGTGLENKYVARVSGFPGNTFTGGGGYYSLLNGPNKTANVWVKLSVSASTSAIRFYVDDVESTADANTTITGAPTAVMNKLRLGNGVSPNKAGSIDNVLVTGPGSDVADWNMY